MQDSDRKPIHAGTFDSATPFNLALAVKLTIQGTRGQFSDGTPVTKSQRAASKQLLVQ